MTNVPEGWHTITPRLFVHEPMRLVEFLRETFEATGDFQSERPTELRIGDSMVMISGDEVRDPTSSFLYLYVDDIDATYARALACGAQSLEEPLDTPYGDRRAMIKDPSGNVWQVATRK